MNLAARPEASSPDAAAAESTETSRVDKFGVDARGLEVIDDRVQRNETFSDLLAGHAVPYQQIVTVARAVRDTFDVRRIRAGKPYRVYVDSASQQARYLAYASSRTRSVVIDLQQPDRSRIHTRDVQTTWTTASGTITGSLYATLQRQGAHPALTLQLSEVFAWQIDFFRLRRGDRFRIVYEERSVDGERIGPGDIVAAAVTHRGTTYHAFQFDEGRGDEYFDADGNSVRRALLKAPLRFTRISSGFSNRRLHPVLKRYRPHHGTDYAAPRGTPVRSVGDGEVIFAGPKGANGNYVKIRHNSTYTTGYLHLSRIAVRRGATVSQGEVIGYVGSTGLSTGPHLDYRLWKHNTPVDPYRIEMPPSRPVALQHRAAFERHVDALLDRLHPAPVVQRSTV